MNNESPSPSTLLAELDALEKRLLLETAGCADIAHEAPDKGVRLAFNKLGVLLTDTLNLLSRCRCALLEGGHPMGRDADWVLAMGHALGLDSGYRVPLLPNPELLKELFDAVRASALRVGEPTRDFIEQVAKLGMSEITQDNGPDMRTCPCCCATQLGRGSLYNVGGRPWVPDADMIHKPWCVIPKAQAMLSAAPVSAKAGEGWIKASERLPEPDEIVLTWNENGFLNLATNVRPNSTYPQLGYLGAGVEPNRPVFGITHWQPLPAGPQQEGK